MRTSTIIGMALGAVLGAMVIESYKPMQDAVSKSKKMLKNKFDSISQKKMY